MKNDNVKMLVTFVSLIVVSCLYMLVNKYIIEEPGSVEKEVSEKEQNTGLSEDDAIRLAKEKFYIAEASLTNTSSDIDKLYNSIKTKDIVLTDENLINSLNEFNVKTYTANSSVSMISNYSEVITNNFTEEYIHNNILYPKGFIALIGGDYYIIKDKTDNYFLKDAEFTLMSKTDTELYFSVKVTNYATSCVAAGETVPSITCTATSNKTKDFRLGKDNDRWKIKELEL